MRGNAKILAAVALLSAAGCKDVFEAGKAPLDQFYYPVGMAVRQLPPGPSTPAGTSQLVVLSSNFDLRYDEATGGTVIVVDPDASQDTTLGGGLAVLPGGALHTGSFGGEVALSEGSCPPAWPGCPTACPPLLADPGVAGGGAKVVVTSRSSRMVYRLDMDAAGALACGAGCTTQLPVQSLDPYGVTNVCASRDGIPVAQTYVTQLRGVASAGLLTRVDLLDGTSLTLDLGAAMTYSSAYDPAAERLFVSTRSGDIISPLRWFNPLVGLEDLGGYAVPDQRSKDLGAVIQSAQARGVAVSNDGRFLYAGVDLFDYDRAVSTGVLVTQGGAMAVLDLAPNALNQPRLTLSRLVPTCFGAGQVKVLPQRRAPDGTQSKRDLVAISCPFQSALLLYDDEQGTIVHHAGLDPDTGSPLLGREPFGLAVEPIDPARRTVPVGAAIYSPSPCQPGRACNRIYVGSFLDNWVNVLELDPDHPQDVALVKRIGRGP